MSIDNIAKFNSTQVGPVTTKPAPQPAASPRQELPGTGQAVPPAASSTEVKQAITRLNNFVQSQQRDLRFRVDEATDRLVVTVVNAESGEVIRQIPTEEVMAVARSLEMAQGLLVNERA